MKKRNQFGKKITSVARRELIYDVDVVHISTCFPAERNFIVKVHHTRFGPRRYIYVSNNDFSELCSFHRYISKGDYERIFLNGILPYSGFLYFVDTVSIKTYYFEMG